MFSKKTQKLIATLIAGVLVLCMIVPLFAAALR